jgi:hypothetical protein
MVALVVAGVAFIAIDWNMCKEDGKIGNLQIWIVVMFCVPGCVNACCAPLASSSIPADQMTDAQKRSAAAAKSAVFLVSYVPFICWGFSVVYSPGGVCVELKDKGGLYIWAQFYIWCLAALSLFQCCVVCIGFASR